MILKDVPLNNGQSLKLRANFFSWAALQKPSRQLMTRSLLECAWQTLGLARVLDH